MIHCISDCGNIPTINNGTINLDSPGVTTYLATAKVTCDTGFNVTSETIYCQANGKWQESVCVLKGNNCYKYHLYFRCLCMTYYI